MKPSDNLKERIESILLEFEDGRTGNAYYIKESQEVLDLAKAELLQLFQDYAMGCVKVERERLLTPNQQKMLAEIRATLSPTLSDLMRNTGYKNGTAQSALRGLVSAGLVEKKGKVYVEKTT